MWLSLVPPIPALALALVADGPGASSRSAAAASWPAIGAALYLGLAATVVAYAIWGFLLRRYPAASVTPFALLAPFVAAGAAALMLGERFGLCVGRMALVLAGLAALVLRPASRQDL